MVLTVYLSLLQEYKRVVAAGEATKDELLDLTKEIVGIALADRGVSVNEDDASPSMIEELKERWRKRPTDEGGGLKPKLDES
jgi:hypothetical protein